MNPKNDIWFPKKKYGLGWGFPVKWQGWAVFAAYLALLIGGSIVIDPETRLPVYLVYFVFISSILSVICYLKGDKPRWRWGDRGL